MKPIHQKLLLLIAVISLAGPLRAEDTTVLARGFKPNGVFQVNDFDSVNAFNGNLMLRVPLGQQYTSNGSLAYQFMLHYNSQAWELFSAEGIEFGGAMLQTSFVTSRYDIVTGADGHRLVTWSAGSTARSPATSSVPDAGAVQTAGTPAFAWVESFPSGNAGVGWSFSFGELSDAFAYTAPDGATSVFHPSLHGDEIGPDGENYGELPDWYTTDGTYLRMRRFPSNAQETFPREVDSPDGIRRHFHCAARCNAYRTVWVLDWMSDPYGNVLKIGYSPAAPPANGLWTWTINQGSVANAEAPGTATQYYDGASQLNVIRTHYAYFTKPIEGSQRLERLALQVTNSGPSARYALYDFVYAQATVPSNISIPWPKNHNELMQYTQETETVGGKTRTSERLTVSELAAIRLPNPGSSGPPSPPCFGPGQPGGCTAPAPSSGIWQFRYYDSKDATDPNDPAPVCENNTQPSPSGECNGGEFYPVSSTPALLRMAKPPTGGGYRYEYGHRGYPVSTCGGRGALEGASFTGVAKRQQIDDAEQDVPNALWLYVGQAWLRSVDLSTNCPHVSEFISAVISPPANAPTDPNTHVDFDRDAHIALAFFSMAPDQPSIDWTHSGWPYTEEEQLCSGGFSPPQPTCAGPGAKYLSTREVEGRYVDFLADPSGAVRKIFTRYVRAGESQTPTTPLRSTYVRYKASFLRCPDGSGRGTCVSSNLRNELTHQVFEDDAHRLTLDHVYVENVLADFDGLGHYRQADQWNNFGQQSNPAFGAGLEHRTAVTKYNTVPTEVVYHDGDRLPANAPATDPHHPEIADPWFLNMYASQEVGEGDVRFRKEVTFDRNRAFITSTRTLTDTTGPGGGALSQSDSDVVQTTQRAGSFQQTPTVTVTSSWFGGDAGSGSLTTPSYVKETILKYGATESEAYRGCDGAVLHKTQDNTLDPGTGLAIQVGDGSGASNTYTYDTLGRVASVTPPSGAVTQNYTYTYGTAGNTGLECEAIPYNPQTCSGAPRPAGQTKLEIRRGDGSEGPFTTYFYDFLGRMTRTDEKLPSGTGAVNTTTLLYSTRGLVLDDITARPTTNSAATAGDTHHVYDELGREILTKASDSTQKRFQYAGIRSTTLTQTKVATGFDGLFGTADHTEIRDGFGRLRRVNDTRVRAEYDYDPADHMTAATLIDLGTNQVQERTFTWDGRGFMTSETQPELQGHTLTYADLDALGHAGTVHYPGNASSPALTLWNRYDRAERLVQSGAVGQPDILKQYDYFGEDAAFVGKRGRLRESLRHNLVPKADNLSGLQKIDVTKTYDYDSAGRLKKIDLASPYAALNSTTAYDYDNYDQLSKISYPTLPGASVPVRNVLLAYSRGRLQNVGTASSAGQFATLKYNRNGTLWKISRTRNGATYDDEIVPDVSGIPRVGELKWSYAGTPIDASGLYRYDSAGNIYGIKNDQYTYDTAFRLTGARIGSATQTYNYDGFGNMTSWADGVVTHHNEVVVATNQLATSVYDNLGNIIRTPDTRPSSPPSSNLNFSYDVFSAVTSFDALSLRRVFVYDADGERVATFDYKQSDGALHEHWYLRGVDNLVLRDVDRASGAWTWQKDYIYRGSMLTSTIGVPESGPGEELHDVHVDHLGSTHMVTGPTGAPVVRQGIPDSPRKYWPFGELTVTRPLIERMVFTGHERDDDGSGYPDANLDYMHARYYAPALGRFLSRDPAPGRGDTPQSWNRYAYVLDNPLVLTDANGQEPQQQNEYRGTQHYKNACHTKLDNIFFGAMGKLGLAAVSVPMIPLRVLVGTVFVGGALGDLQERATNKNADSKSTAGAVIDAATTAVIARGAMIGVEKLLPSNPDKDATGDGIAGVISLVSGSDVSMTLGLKPLPDDAGVCIEDKKPSNDAPRKDGKK